MRIGSILAYTFGLFASVSATRPSLWDSCGSDARLLKESTIEHDGNVVKVATTSCPGFANLTSNALAAPSRITKRAVTQCDLSPSACNILCNPLDTQASLIDCTLLSLTLSLQLTTFSAAPFSFTTFNLGTCQFAFANLDLTQYDVCHGFMGSHGQGIVTQCVLTTPSTLAGFCVSLGILNNNWIVEAIHS
ncbi:hypothetical protein Hypma_007595 [Hypsizygus marmoreus]|uniref:Cyanovirin-N domain-containing protein n=1 Tax=Hypsizygus marmoreus TaxID=39966 RepID=A0A369JY26_HYPMA|nr:hypothetical protein Hypma_007595 [Hypsizygus marmoreus]